MRHDVPGYSEWEGDIVKGYRFSATIQLRNTYRVLSMHGYYHEGSNPPEITNEAWEGTWVLVVKSFREMGIDIDGTLELGGTMASDIGQIPKDGGEYLKFLLCVREIVERQKSIADRVSALEQELRNPLWAGICKKLGGKRAIPYRFFPHFVDCIPGLPLDAIHALTDRKMTTPKLILAASHTELLSIKGVGQAKLKAIRLACQQAKDQESERVDTVTR